MLGVMGFSGSLPLFVTIIDIILYLCLLIGRIKMLACLTHVSVVVDHCPPKLNISH